MQSEMTRSQKANQIIEAKDKALADVRRERDRYRAERDELQVKLDQDRYKKDVDNLRGHVSDLTTKNKALEAQVASLTEQLQTEADDLTALDAKLDAELVSSGVVSTAPPEGAGPGVPSEFTETSQAMAVDTAAQAAAAGPGDAAYAETPRDQPPPPADPGHTYREQPPPTEEISPLETESEPDTSPEAEADDADDGTDAGDPAFTQQSEQ